MQRFVMQMTSLLNACEMCQQTILIGSSFLKTAANILTESTTCTGSIPEESFKNELRHTALSPCDRSDNVSPNP